MITVKWPFVRTASGGVARTQTPEEATAQDIVISLSPGKSAHPFQLRDRIGMPGTDYDVAGTSLSGDTADFVQERFRSLQRASRARLDGQPVVVSIENGVRKVMVNYVDLEVQTTRSAEVSDA
jgi:hypothetical protein